MLPWEKTAGIIVIVGCGVFFLASGFQTLGHNWAGQHCPRLDGVCINPEWIGIGAACLATGYFFWRKWGQP
jgi:hypothetical protein